MIWHRNILFQPVPISGGGQVSSSITLSILLPNITLLLSSSDSRYSPLILHNSKRIHPTSLSYILIPTSPSSIPLRPDFLFTLPPFPSLPPLSSAPPPHSLSSPLPPTSPLFCPCSLPLPFHLTPLPSLRSLSSLLPYHLVPPLPLLPSPY